MSDRHDHASSAAISLRVNALVDHLEKQGTLRDGELAGIVENLLLKATPANGRRLIVRAWRDPEFKARLLADANAAAAECGIDLSHWSPVILRAVENTATLHNLVVCTLCSCYPIALLGPSPTWYKSEAYRAAAVRDPRGVLEQFGVSLAPHVEIRVWDSTADVRYIVIPRQPDGARDLPDEQLAAMITRDAMIGTALL